MSDKGRWLYRGSCHCGLFAYETRLAEIKSAYKCNCSLCLKKGYLWIFPGQNNFKVLTGNEDKLTTYKFGPKLLNHKFCPTCGASILGCTKGDDPELDLALNACTIDGLNTAVLKHTLYDGASIGEPYEFPTHVGDGPTRVLRNHKTYTGSCHCGALTLAVNLRLDSPNPDVQECDCVVCRVRGCTWLYSKIGQTVVAGHAGSAVRYKGGRHGLVFCKTCGVTIVSEVMEVTDGDAAVEPSSIHAVNARAIHDIEPGMAKMLGL